MYYTRYITYINVMNEPYNIYMYKLKLFQILPNSENKLFNTQELLNKLIYQSPSILLGECNLCTKRNAEYVN